MKLETLLSPRAALLLMLSLGATSAACGSVADISADAGPEGGACELADLDCPEHAMCVDSGGEAECQCIEGHTGADCTSCDEGYQDNDGDGACQASCSQEDCSNAGTCDDASGTAVCTCDQFRGGESCESCASGYAFDDNDDCVWDGLIIDGGFDGGDGWDVAGSVTVADSQASFSPAALCAGGSVSQTVQMPPRRTSEPLVLRFRTQSEDSFGSEEKLAAYAGEFHAPIYRVGATFAETEALTELCLGRGAYGRELSIVFDRAALGACSLTESIQLDSVDIRPDQDGICPTETGLVNGDFQDGETGWEGTATISGGQLLFSGSQCGNQTSKTTRVAFPAASESPGQALQVTYRAGTDGGNSSDSVRLTSSAAGAGAGTSCTSAGPLLAPLNAATVTTDTACVPRNFVGSVADVTLLIARKTGCGCASLYTYDSMVEEIALIDEPACGGALPDADFESDLRASAAWVYNDATSTGTLQKIASAAQAHAGSKYLELGIGQHCDSFAASRTIAIPPSDGEAGPALKYWYHLPADGGAGQPSFDVCIDGDCETLAENGDWQQQTTCLDFSAAGVPVEVTLRAAGGSAGSCSNTYSAESIRFDDFEVTTDSSCDTQ